VAARKAIALPHQAWMAASISRPPPNAPGVGADTFVSGTTLFRAHNLKAAVRKMRQIVNANDPALADLKV